MAATAATDITRDGIGIVDYFQKFLGKGITVRIILEPHGGVSVNFTQEKVLGIRGGGFRKAVKSATGYSEHNPLLAAMQAEERWNKE